MSSRSLSSYDHNLMGDEALSVSQLVDLILSGQIWSQSQFLYALLIIPVIWILYFLLFNTKNQNRKYTKFADKHLLPYLLMNEDSKKKKSIYSGLILWSAIWFCLTLAMAGPRWSYREFEAYSKEQNMVVLLDMSLSMNANDVAPSRFQRARQEIEDILNMARARGNSKVKIGLVGFAAHAHMISPISEDYSNIKRLLPLLGSDLISVQGTRISAALKTAEAMLSMEAGAAKSILIISDGGFDDNSSAASIIANLDSKGITLHVMGVGSKEGMNFIDVDGNPLIKNGSVAITKLEEEKLQEVASLGRGIYFNSDILGKNSLQILEALNNQIDYLKDHQQSIKDWDEKFYIFLFPVVFLGLFWFRKGLVFPFIILILLAPYSAGAVDIMDRLILNDDHYAKKALMEDNDVETALEYFDDPYHRGIAHYRAGDFEKAEAEFRKETPKYELDSLYNLGNTLAKQGKYEEASKIYSEVIGKDCKHEGANHNLGIMQRVLALVEIEQKKDDSKKSKDSDEENKFPEGGGGGGGGDDDEGQSGGDGSDEGGAEDEGDSSSDGDDDKKGEGEDQDQDSEPGGEDKGGDDKGGDDKDPAQDSDEGDQGKENKGDNDKGDDNGDKTCDSDEEDKGDDDGKDREDKKNSGGDGDKDDKGDKDGDKESEAGDGDDKGKNRVDTDEWLNRIENDYRKFLATQFYLESQNQKSESDNNIDPW